jgi:hypothetical protein
MSAAAPLPSMFGRFTAILKDHAHLGKTLRRLRAMCSALEGDQVTTALDASPPLVLRRLRIELAEHFAAEESHGYFGTVIAEVPALSAQVGILKSEHQAMLQAADALLELARDARRWDFLPEPARALIDQLERHERAESVLLSGFFSRS